MRTAARSAAGVSSETIWLTGSPAKRNIENAMIADRDHDADGLDSAAKSESEHVIPFTSLLIRRRTSLSPGNEKSRKPLSRRDLVLKPD